MVFRWSTNVELETLTLKLETWNLERLNWTFR